jgi:putative flippase GtrA
MIELIFGLIKKFKVIIKFLLSGLTATAVDLAFLYIFTDIYKIHYLVSAVLAFAIAFCVSFYLQKFWTFRDDDRERLYTQLSQYIAVTLTNLVVNTYGMFWLVEKWGIKYLFAQVIMSAFIAIFSFIIYRFVIFREKSATKLT